MRVLVVRVQVWVVRLLLRLLLLRLPRVVLLALLLRVLVRSLDNDLLNCGHFVKRSDFAALSHWTAFLLTLFRRSHILSSSSSAGHIPPELFCPLLGSGLRTPSSMMPFSAVIECDDGEQDALVVLDALPSGGGSSASVGPELFIHRMVEDTPSSTHQCELTCVALNNNRLTGPIPSQIGLATKLQELHLSSNSLSGDIPTELNRCTLLRELTLTENEQLTGVVPKEVLMVLTECDWFSEFQLPIQRSNSSGRRRGGNVVILNSPSLDMSGSGRRDGTGSRSYYRCYGCDYCCS